jgi:DNA-binding XRE family transcriptional regulator
VPIRFHLTIGELRTLVRRRHGLSQADYAREVGTSRNALRERELDGTPSRGTTALMWHEWCWLQRRRSGVLSKDLARSIGVCPWWLSQMERGRASCVRLVDYWHSK